MARGKDGRVLTGAAAAAHKKKAAKYGPKGADGRPLTGVALSAHMRKIGKH